MVSPSPKAEATARPAIPLRVRRVVVVGAPAAGVVVKPVMLVTVEVQDTQRRSVARTMRRTDKLQGLMDYYYDVVSLGDAGARGAGRFVFDGKRVRGEDTPEGLNMANGEKIDFFEDLLSG
ncbi:hypothetical protein U9M48_015661 [Paspalum notatum var. saurae]|uniref:Ubiquitin-like domain-containing protein n=1 Tax=Paspalum notatum var. saurae TaxID=547442 RepID=A0AAQ3WM19_PASNO